MTPVEYSPHYYIQSDVGGLVKAIVDMISVQVGTFFVASCGLVICVSAFKPGGAGLDSRLVTTVVFRKGRSDNVF